MKINFEISREEVESVLNIGGRLLLEAKEQSKNSELVRVLQVAAPAFVSQVGAYLTRKAEAADASDDGNDADEQPRKTEDEPASAAA